MGGSSGSSSQSKDPWFPAQGALKYGIGELRPAYDRASRINAPGTSEYGLSNTAAPYLRSTIRGEYLRGNPYMDDIIRRTTGDVGAAFEGAGRYGSGVHQQAIANAAAGIRYQNYGMERANQMNAIQAAPGYDMAPYEMYGARVAAPYEALSRYTELAGTYGGQGGVQTQPIYRNRTAGALGGAASGAAAGSMVLPGWGTAIGAVAGGLLGAYG